MLGVVVDRVRDSAEVTIRELINAGLIPRRDAAQEQARRLGGSHRDGASRRDRSNWMVRSFDPRPQLGTRCVEVQRTVGGSGSFLTGVG